MMELLAARQLEIFSIAWLVLSFSLLLNFQQARKNKKQAVQQQRMQAELETAQHIQKALLTPAPQIPGYQIAAKYETAESLGGDFYHFFHGPERLGVVIGDVSGHGISSALVMALTEGLMDERNLENLKPHEILKTLNDHLKKFLQGSQNYVTLLVAILDLHSGKLEYACAGHPPVIHYRAQTQKTAELAGGGSMLGIFDDNGYETQSAQLESGDSLLFYTDGLTEARNPQSDFFGSTGLERVLRQNPTRSALETLEGLYQQLHHFSPVIQDDRAAILIKKI